MPRAVKPRDPETGEKIEDGEQQLGPQGSDKRSKANKAVSLRIAEERLKRLRKQNKKIDLDIQSRSGGLVDYETIKRQVIQANLSVKQQVLAVIERANLARETKIDLKQQLTQALNDLAYERTETHAE